ncbi:MAG: hypothetical protein PVS2B1_16330 [Candidatus Dormibacteraceae bacterium]
MLGLTSSRSIFQTVPDSLYEPVIRKLLLASRLSAAPLSSARVVGDPMPKGMPHALSSTGTINATAARDNMARSCNDGSTAAVTKT